MGDCTKRKHIKHLINRTITKNTQLIQLIDINICRAFNVSTFDGEKYFIFFSFITNHLSLSYKYIFVNTFYLLSRETGNLKGENR